jgi:hypothetical protein
MDRGEGGRIARRFVLGSLPWVVGASVLWLITVSVVASVSVAILHAAAVTLAMVLAFSSFAGGVAVSSLARQRGQLLRVAIVSLVYASVVFVDLAYVAPIARFVQMESDSTDERFPLGPETPSVLKALRDSVTADPPENPVFGSTVVLDSSPSYFERQIQVPRVVGALTIVLSFLGLSVGVLTGTLRFGVRHRVRWAVGLGLALSVVASDQLVTSALR